MCSISFTVLLYCTVLYCTVFDLIDVCEERDPHVDCSVEFVECSLFPFIVSIGGVQY